ncbi:hypothetical protein E8E13_004476 [Curvularia kusanoi]|uniref:Uncharacterized protein n=1 Tax=Curvularia kusanoi TaxID=90978 RepID=A0A9P4T7H0_CURKU|nr:hypothetical protein E8E13_004476 [Curvularia kusanoi]
MATPDIDTNVWYSLYIASDPNSLLMSTNLFSRDGTAGAAFFATRAADNATQRKATSTSTNPSTGLSTPAKAGLGAALGIAALIALVVLGLFLRRRHRAQKRIETTMTKDVAFEPNQFAPSLPERRQEFAKYELDHGSGSAKFEMPHQAVVEVDARGQERPAELMGDVERRRG